MILSRHRSARPSVVFLLLLAAATVLPAQAPSTAPPRSVSVPAAYAADVASPEAVVAALYDVLSGAPGEPRDWNRLRALFAPEGRMLPVIPRADGFAALQMTPDEYVARSGAVIARFGFVERELARRIERFGNVVHVWSTYEGRFSAPGAPTADPIRGINSIQLTGDGTRWYVQSLSWEAERPDLPIPAAYLPPPSR